jgi:hypothetical protein
MLCYAVLLEAAIAFTVMHLTVWGIRAIVVALAGSLRRESVQRFHKQSVSDAMGLLVGVLQMVLVMSLVPVFHEGSRVVAREGPGEQLGEPDDSSLVLPLPPSSDLDVT